MKLIRRKFNHKGGKKVVSNIIWTNLADGVYELILSISKKNCEIVEHSVYSSNKREIVFYIFADQEQRELLETFVFEIDEKYTYFPVKHKYDYHAIYVSQDSRLKAFENPVWVI